VLGLGVFELQVVQAVEQGLYPALSKVRSYTGVLA